MALLNFDASQVQPSMGQPDPVPSGWYIAAIDESEMKPTKDGLGTYLQVRYSIQDGQYKNHKVYSRLNLRNQNPQAQEIAYKELSAICHAAGMLQVQDSVQLHGIPVRIKVKLRAADGQYEASNEISAVKHISEQVDGGQAPMQAPMQAPVAPVGGAAWQAPPAQQPWQGSAPVQQAAPQQPAQQPWQQQAPAAPQQAPAQAAQPWAAQQPAQQPAPAQAAPVAGMPPWAQQG